MLEWVKSAIHYWNEGKDGRETQENRVSEFEAGYGQILEKAKKDVQDTIQKIVNKEKESY